MDNQSHELDRVRRDLLDMRDAAQGLALALRNLLATKLGEGGTIHDSDLIAKNAINYYNSVSKKQGYKNG